MTRFVNAGRSIALIAIGAGILAMIFAWIVWTLVASDSTTDAADRVGAVVAVFGLVAAMGAIAVAWLTIKQQQIESRRQRHMETLHLVNEQYERVFDDILHLREAEAPIKEIMKRRIYNRYFTNLMTGFRYYELGLIPRQDFEEWTATLIDRLKLGSDIVTGDRIEDRNELLSRWREFDAWGHGPRSAFRCYIESVIAEGGPINSAPALAARHALAKGVGTDEHRAALAENRKQLAEAAARVVGAIRIIE